MEYFKNNTKEENLTADEKVKILAEALKAANVNICKNAPFSAQIIIINALERVGEMNTND